MAHPFHTKLHHPLLLASALLASGANIAHAQVPRSAEADIVRKQAETFTVPAPATSISEQNTIAVEVPKGAENVRFTLKRVNVEGSSVYSDETLSAFYEPLIGKEVSLADMYVVAAQITQRYVADGYALTLAFLPPQKIDSGIVRINVAEGHIQTVNWAGAPLESALAKDIIDDLRNKKPLKNNDLESAMLHLNDLPSVQAQAALAPDPSGKRGAIALTINIERKHLSAQLGINSYASRYLGVWQANAQADVAGIFTAGDEFSINGSRSIDPQYSRYVRGEYSIVVDPSGTSLKFGASDSKSNPGFQIEVLEIESTARSYYVGVSQPLIRTREENWNVSAQFSLNNQETSILQTRLYQDRLRTLQLSTLYNRVDSWAGANLASASLTQGLDVFNATRTGQANLSRANGHSDFTKITTDLSRMQSLGSNFSLLGSFSGQWSSAPLLSSEEFGLGGPSFGRAYDSSEISGDKGFALSAELRYDYTYDNNLSVQPYLYYDIGRVYSNTDGTRPVSLASAGGGVRLTLFEHVYSDLYAALPLTYTPATPKLGSENKDARFGVSVTFTY